MKRIINGVTYNTDTATFVARISELQEEFHGRPEERTEYRLYQTRGGAFFVHTHTETLKKTVRGEWEPIERDYFEPMTRDQAQKWISENEGGEVELIDDQVFGEPPEASEEATPGATVYLRVPTSLKDRWDRSAKSEGVSLNAWMMKCGQRCTHFDTISSSLNMIIESGKLLETDLAQGANAEATLREIVKLMQGHAQAAADVISRGERQ